MASNWSDVATEFRHIFADLKTCGSAKSKLLLKLSFAAGLSEKCISQKGKGQNAVKNLLLEVLLDWINCQENVVWAKQKKMTSRNVSKFSSSNKKPEAKCRMTLSMLMSQALPCAIQ